VFLKKAYLKDKNILAVGKTGWRKKANILIKKF
jgi:hypothetical protein